MFLNKGDVGSAALKLSQVVVLEGPAPVPYAMLAQVSSLKHLSGQIKVAQASGSVENTCVSLWSCFFFWPQVLGDHTDSQTASLVPP